MPIVLTATGLVNLPRSGRRGIHVPTAHRAAAVSGMRGASVAALIGAGQKRIGQVAKQTLHFRDTFVVAEANF